jgi:hypothetical protein
MSMIGNYLIVSKQDLDSLYADPDSISDFLYEEKSEEIIDIDKAWHAIHFTLNGSEWEGQLPLFYTVLGGAPIGEEDIGYGPARGLYHQEVCETSEALQEIDEKRFREMFNLKALSENNIYPEIWNEGEEELLKTYIIPNYLEIRDTFHKACKENKCLILFLN